MEYMDGQEAKVGDLVKTHRMAPLSLKPGTKAVVVSMEGDYLTLKWVERRDTKRRNGQHDGGYTGTYLILVERMGE